MAVLKPWRIYTTQRLLGQLPVFCVKWYRAACVRHPELLKFRKGAAAGHITVSFVGFKTKCQGFILYHYYNDGLKELCDSCTLMKLEFKWTFSPHLTMIRKQTKIFLFSVWGMCICVIFQGILVIPLPFFKGFFVHKFLVVRLNDLV